MSSIFSFFGPTPPPASSPRLPKRSIFVYYNSSVYIEPEVSLYIIKCSAVFSFFYTHSTIRRLFDVFIFLFYFYLNKKFIIFQNLRYRHFDIFLHLTTHISTTRQQSQLWKEVFYSCSMTYYITTYDLSSRLNNSIARTFYIVYTCIGCINKRVFF